jgi:hypothetical protein
LKVVSALVAKLTPPYPLIGAFVTNWAKAGFFAQNLNQLRTPFFDSKPLNGYFLHAIVEFKDFGFVGMVICRLALGISGTVTACCGGSSNRIAPKFPANGRRMYPNLLGSFFWLLTALKKASI